MIFKEKNNIQNLDNIKKDIQYDFDNFEVNPEQLQSKMFFYEVTISCNEKSITKIKLIEIFKKVNFNLFQDSPIYSLVHVFIYPHNKNSIRHYIRFTIALSKRVTLKELMFEFRNKIVNINPNILNIQIIKHKLVKNGSEISAIDYFEKLDIYLKDKLKKDFSKEDYLILTIN